ncbi:cold shock domain-containing protein [Pseudovibrio sp. Tun.PSC04-5.I4]|uniref:cold-shock protein n=1 Tax=Pseudovibrio sp. Tun.PSC04-5.I4 TaxID=1798213 RepID=UPI000889AF24|nr:cold shock domain-containing protein [Pseudovibrio sp. Tun.PSC04-5.I4]SDR01553.1 cold shock protein (beta-ribbon, CspA family) [Pseudovibrio sp. Tun.PSC04-5.I4]
MINGSVEFFNSEQGFGYIQQEGSASQFRVLRASLIRAGIKKLTERQKVRFDTHTDPVSGKIHVNNIEIA